MREISHVPDLVEVLDHEALFQQLPVPRQPGRREVPALGRLDDRHAGKLAREHRQIRALAIERIDKASGVPDHHHPVSIKPWQPIVASFRDQVR